MKDFFGYGRKRDESGAVVKRFLNTYVNCLHTQVGHARENMEVLVAEFDMSEIIYVGQMSSSQNCRVIDPSGISYAVTNGHKDGEPKIIEPITCAMRGRDPDNPSERSRSNGKYKQRIEMGSNISNTITSVQKDALVAEPMIIQKFGDRGTNQYSVRDIAHTIPSNPMSDGGQLLAEPQPIIIDDYNQRIPQDQNVIGTVTTEFGKDALRHGYKIAEPLCIPQATKQGYIEVSPGSVFDASYPDSKTRRGRVQEGGQVSHTLMAGGEAPCYYEGKIQHPVIIDDTVGYKEEPIIYTDYSPTLRSERHGLKCTEPQGISVHPNSHALEFKGEQSIKQDASPALRATDYKCPHVVWEKEPSYRIRKLTPRECFRLMGVSETDIDKIQQSGVSQSQQYKMAGNSIVVDCLYHIFRKMLTETQCESQQLSLF